MTPPRTAEDELDSPDLCAVTPFFSSPSSVIPWHTLSSSYAEIAYRFCKVKRWTSNHHAYEAQHQAQAIENGRVIRVGHDERPVKLAAYLDKLHQETGSDARTKYLLTYVIPVPCCDVALIKVSVTCCFVRSSRAATAFSHRLSRANGSCPNPRLALPTSLALSSPLRAYLGGHHQPC
jgi:hypothetical protein